MNHQRTIKSQVVYRGRDSDMLFQLMEDNTLYAVRGRKDGACFHMLVDTRERIELSESQLNELYCGVLDMWDYRILKQLYNTRHFVPLFEEDAEIVAQN